MNFLNKAALVAAGTMLAACATSHSLPRSELPTPTEVVDGSAIALRALMQDCSFVELIIAPELEPGLYGEGRMLEFSRVEVIVPGSKRMLADGEKVHRVELPPGDYGVARFVCTQNNLIVQSYSDRPEILASFSVEPGATTYIGDLVLKRVGTQRILLLVNDGGDEALAAFREAYPGRAASLKVKIAEQ